MSEPSREHIDSVRALLIECGADSLHGWRCAYPDRYGPCDCTTELATDVLTSTDQAVWDAIAAHIPMDALVRVGRLTEQRSEWGVMHHDGSVSSRFNGRTAKGRCYSEAGHLSFIHAPDNIRPASRRVFVTEWTEAPDA